MSTLPDPRQTGYCSARPVRPPARSSTQRHGARAKLEALGCGAVGSHSDQVRRPLRQSSTSWSAGCPYEAEAPREPPESSRAAASTTRTPQLIRRDRQRELNAADLFLEPEQAAQITGGAPGTAELVVEHLERQGAGPSGLQQVLRKTSSSPCPGRVDTPPARGSMRGAAHRPVAGRDLFRRHGTRQAGQIVTKGERGSCRGKGRARLAVRDLPGLRQRFTWRLSERP